MTTLFLIIAVFCATGSLSTLPMITVDKVTGLAPVLNVLAFGILLALWSIAALLAAVLVELANLKAVTG